MPELSSPSRSRLRSTTPQPMGGDEDPAAAPISGGRKTFWRSASWSSSRPPTKGSAVDGGDPRPRQAPPSIVPRSNSSKGRSFLPPLSIARRSLDEWPSAGSDDLGEWPHQPPTPGAGAAADLGKPGEGLKLDLSSLKTQPKKKDRISFDQECSKVADHIYLGGDAVAKNREILRHNGITHVLNCVGFVCPEYFKSDLVYKTLWLHDSPSEDITSILYDVFDYFEDVREQKGRVFVHCCQGVSRSTSLVIAYLMWREGQSFDDAFQFVKAARGIANPNMGFACQLLQCQKRVHAVPLSPNSVLRMYRMAPHSPYDPLHLVPKLLTDPLPVALDSRGVFILHVFSTIYVWLGKNCELVMEKDGKAAAFQVVRYERVQGAVMTIEEGHEPSGFWDAFSNAHPSSDTGLKVNKEDIESTIKISAGKRKVEAYDADFELFYKAISGGVVPSFPSSGPGHETHLPARESNWSILRRKFIPGTSSRVYSGSALVRDLNPHIDRVQFLSAESLTSPPYLSPSSISSDSSCSSNFSLDSPSFSPSTSSSSSFAHSPAISNLSDSLLPSSRNSPNNSSNPEELKPFTRGIPLCSKRLSRSISERRGSFSSLKLPTLSKDFSLSFEKAMNRPSAYCGNPHEVLEKRNYDKFLNKISVDSASVRQFPDFKFLDESADICSEKHVDQSDKYRLENIPMYSPRELIDVYRYPGMEKLSTLGREGLDSKAVHLFLTQNKDGETDRTLYLWIGDDFKTDNGQPQLNSGIGASRNEIDWNEVGSDFLALMGLQEDIPIKVVKEREAEDFLQLLNTR